MRKLISYHFIFPFLHMLGASLFLKGASKGDYKSCFHAGLLHKSRPEIAWNSCSRQVYPIPLDARLVMHAITQFLPSNSRVHALKYAITFSPWAPPKDPSSVHEITPVIGHCPAQFHLWPTVSDPILVLTKNFSLSFFYRFTNTRFFLIRQSSIRK